MHIRTIQTEDRQAVWDIFHQVVQKGDAYVFAPDTSYEDFLEIWLGKGKYAYVAVLEEEIVGSYFIKANQMDLGSHVANAGFMVKPNQQGKGIGRALGQHALAEAPELGFQAMQFNMVIQTNQAAVRLWQSLGFQILATLPKVFQHQKLGLVDAYLMHRFL